MKDTGLGGTAQEGAQAAGGGGGRPGDDVVADVIQARRAFVGGTAIAGFATMVVDDVIDEVEADVVAEPGIAAAVMGVQIVMETDAAAAIAEQRAVAVLALLMAGTIQARGDERPLHGDAIGVGDGERFIDAPGGGDVIEDDVLRTVHLEAVVLHAGAIAVTGTEAQIADDDVVGTNDPRCPTRDGDAVTGRGLSGEGEEGLIDGQRGGELDGAGKVEDYRARSGGGLDTGAQTAGADVVQVGDVVNVATPATLGRCAKALGRGEREWLGSQGQGEE